MLLQRLFKITDPAYLNAMSRAGTIGLHLVSGVAVGSVMGYFLDKWLDTAPWFLAILGFTGIIAGFKNVYVDTKRLIASQENEQRQSDDQKPPPTN